MDGANLMKLENEFGVSIVCLIRFVKILWSKVIYHQEFDFRSYLRYFLFCQLTGKRNTWYEMSKLFMVGLESSDKIYLTKKLNCVECERYTEIEKPPNSNTTSNTDITGVQEYLQECSTQFKK